MKKRFRLISLLLAFLLLAPLFCGAPHASACEGCTMYDDPDWDPTYDPHPEFDTDHKDSGKLVYLNRNVQVYDTTTNQWVQLNKGCKVEILVKVYMDDKWTYTVEFGRIYTDVPINAIDWSKPADSEKVDEPQMDPSYDPHPEFDTDHKDSGKLVYLNRNVQVYDTTTNQWVQLNKGCKVEILVKVYMDDKWTYTVEFGRIYTDVPINAIDWSKPANPENVERHGTLNRNVQAYSSVRKQMEQLDSGCWVNFVRLDVSDDGEYTYTISFGDYGSYTGVPIGSVDWDDGYSPFETNSKKENSKTNQTTNKESSKSSSPAKNEEPQKSPTTKQVKVCIADRYRFFTGTYWERQLFKGNTAMAIAFGEMHMYMK